jgi:hypothetical protein
VWQTVGDEEQAEDGELALGDTFANEELIADEDPNMYAAPLPCVCVCVCVCERVSVWGCVRYAPPAT